MKKILAILLAMSMLLALAVPTSAALNVDNVVFESAEGDTMSGSEAYLDPWGSFAEGPFWGSDHDCFAGISIEEIVAYAKQGGVTFSMLFDASGFATWSGNEGPIVRFNAWDEAGEGKTYDAATTVTTEGDKYLATVSLDDVVAKYVDVTSDEDLDNVMNMAIQTWADNFVLYKAWFTYPAPTYAINVVNGTADMDEASATEIVTVTADAAPEGQAFTHWTAEGVTLEDDTSLVVSFEMPENEVTLTANYQYLNGYSVTVLLPDGDELTAEYYPGNKVTITAPKVDGMKFVNWIVVEGDITLNNENARSTTFTMPESDVVVEAVYDEATGETGRSGYIVMGDEYHAFLIGNGAIVTTPHTFDANNVCIMCGHYVEPVVEDEVVVEITDPVEPSTEEEEDVTVDVEEPAEDTNPTTGLALAVVPMLIAAAAVVISKR